MIARNKSVNGQIPVKDKLKRFNQMKRFNHLTNSRTSSLGELLVSPCLEFVHCLFIRSWEINAHRSILAGRDTIFWSFLFHGNKCVLLSDKTLVLN